MSYVCVVSRTNGCLSIVCLAGFTFCIGQIDIKYKVWFIPKDTDGQIRFI